MTPTTLQAPPTENKSAAVASPPPPAASPKKRGVPWIPIALLFSAGAAAIFFIGRHEHIANEGPKTSVAVTKVVREDLDQDLWLSAEFRPYQEISLHSKVAGYLKSISVDVGDQVKAGQKIAELEVPELEDELAKAQSAYQASLQDVKRAEADFAQSNAAYERLQGVT